MNFPQTDLQLLTLAQAQGLREMIGMYGPLVVLFIVLYMLFIRPEQKRTREHRELIQKLKAGDKVVTNSGIHGTIAGVDQRTIQVTIAENVKVTMDKAAVLRVEKPETE